MSRKTLAYAQRKEIDLYLGTVLKKYGDGLCEYLDGQSDQTVATKFACTVNNVSGVREAMYGRLRPAPARSPLDDRLEALEGRVRVLDEMVLHIQTVVADRLAKALSHQSSPHQPSLDLKAAE